MKKTFLAIAIMIASLTGFSAAAQTTNGCKTPAEQTSADKKADKDARRMRMFDGLNLTADQTASIQALQAEQKAQKDAAKADRKAKKEMAKSDRKAANDARKQKAEASRQSRQRYLESLRGILTPEQYTRFLENNFVNKSAHKGKDRHHAHRSHAGHHEKGAQAKQPRKS